MIEGKTKSGFKFSYDPQNLNDMEFLDALVAAENGDEVAGLTAYSYMCLKLLGKEQRKKLYDHVRLDNGRVPTELIEEELTEMMAAAQEGKN